MKQDILPLFKSGGTSTVVKVDINNMKSQYELSLSPSRKITVLATKVRFKQAPKRCPSEKAGNVSVWKKVLR